MPVLVGELLTLYQSRGDAGGLPRVTPYRDYLAWLARQDRAAAVAAWREALAGLEEGTRLAPSDAGGRRPIAPEQHLFALSAAVDGGADAAGARTGLTLNTVMQAAWGILLGRLTGRSDVVFGVTVAGRPPEIAGIERMVGLFINTLPLRLKLDPATPLLTLLSELQDAQSRLIAHQHLGLAEIQGLTAVGRAVRHAAWCSRTIRSITSSAGGRDRRPAAHECERARCHTLSPGSGGTAGRALQLRLDYRGDLFERGSVEALGDRLVRLLAAAVARPEQSIGRLDILGAGERATLLRGWNDTARAIAPATLPELFGAQAARTPGATAIVFGDERLTYAELDARSNQLAHHLRGLGVGPEVIVALCVERSPEMIVGLLGILRAGGAYLPLDPDYPPERLAFMLADANAPVLVAHSHLVERPGSAQRPHRAHRHPLARHRGPARNRSSPWPAPAQHRLRDLHLGLHRNPQGRRRHAWQRWQLVAAVHHDGVPIDAT